MKDEQKKKLAMLIIGKPAKESKEEHSQDDEKDSDDDYSGMGKEALKISMKKFIKAVQLEEVDKACEHLIDAVNTAKSLKSDDKEEEY